MTLQREALPATYQSWVEYVNHDVGREGTELSAVAECLLAVRAAAEREGIPPLLGADQEDALYYDALRLDGASHNWAEMLALQAPPMSNSDREFLHGTGEQFANTPWLGDYYKAVAERHGQDVKGKFYLSSLAEFPGDPRAWVTGRGDARKVCEERGWGCEGSVNVRPVMPDTDRGPYRVADDIVADRAEDLLAAGVATSAEEAAHAAREQLSPRPRPAARDL